MTIDLRAASSLPRSELAALFTRAYEGYFVPVQVDEAALDFLERTFDLDFDASFVAFDEGNPVGLVNLGVRRNRGWIGGLGIVPEARRQGFGRALMDAAHEQARSRKIEEISLEVIEGNDAAFRLYENLGYELLRWVEIGSLEAAPGDAPADEDWEAAHEHIRAARQAPEPWQRDDDTLRHYGDLRGLDQRDRRRRLPRDAGRPRRPHAVRRRPGRGARSARISARARPRQPLQRAG